MIHYTYRVTEDWRNKKDFTYKWTNNHEDFIKNIRFISLWNNTFDIKWNEFRGSIKEISRKHFKLLGIPEVPNTSWADLNDNDWLIFIDDDDMIPPDLLSIIERHDDRGFIYGDVAYYDLHNNGASFEVQKNYITSCGYSFKVEHLRKLNKSTIYSIFNEHWNLRRDVMNNNIPYHYQAGLCPCYTVDLSSVSQMVKPHNFDRFLNEKSLPYSGPPTLLPKYLEWARPFLSDMSDLIPMLNNSKIRK